MKLTFLGTGGGRFTTITQKRMTGGFRIDGFAGKNFHIDPGPGALVRSFEFGIDPSNLNILFISHAHTDHYNDGEILIEAMTKGMTEKKGLVIGSRSVFEKYRRWGPCISNYHKTRSDLLTLFKDQTIEFDEFIIKGTKTSHGDPTGVGFQLKSNDLTISYTSDTGYSPDLHNYHKGADILISSVLRPGKKSIKCHMSTDNFKDLINEVKPKLGIITHFGLKMIKANPGKEAKRIEKQADVPILAASDGMSINISDKNPSNFEIEYLKRF
ncbi:MAG: MBL fold metallo-hydrolase [Methanobrevibacter sp.]|jgi:phosphoribosyl 1,2-cyclic phosphodiesterase|nr:MBL fold metallo-hydrolase [Candidatus Methanovirga basalitermitum]